MGDSYPHDLETTARDFSKFEICVFPFFFFFSFFIFIFEREHVVMPSHVILYESFS